MSEPMGERAGVPEYLGQPAGHEETSSYQPVGGESQQTGQISAYNSEALNAGTEHHYNEKQALYVDHSHTQMDGQGVHKVNSRGDSLNGHGMLEKGHQDGVRNEDGVLVGEKRGANVVVLGGLDPTSKDGMVHRRLRPRHLSMIAIGGCIGTGLFVGSGESYNTAGPLGIFLGYAIMGFVVWTMMIALGEMTTLFPVSGAFAHYASRFFDPALGFAVGWNYAYSYAITLPTEVTAAAVVMPVLSLLYWNQDISNAVWITIFLVPIYAFNFLGVRYYGEAEFWMSLIKVIAIIGLIILLIIISAGGDPAGDSIGFRYWRDPGPFQQLNGIDGAKGRFLAFWAVFVQAAFSFLGTEIVALTAGEAANPRRNMPRAIKRVFFRILLFYVLGVFVIGLAVDPNDPNLLNGSGNASSSPFVIAINNAQINALPSIVNAVILVSAFSAGNSDLYASSRTLYGVAVAGQAPRFMRYCTKRGIPVFCVIACGLLGPLGYLTVSNTGATVFNWFYNISSITGLITWWAILLTYIRFYHGVKHHGLNRNDFPYKAPLQPYASYFGFIFFTLVIFVFLNDPDTGDSEFTASNFLTAYITLPIFAGFWLFWKIYKRTGFVRLQDMDFVTGRRELDAMDLEEHEKAEAERAPWGGSYVNKAVSWII